MRSARGLPLGERSRLVSRGRLLLLAALASWLLGPAGLLAAPGVCSRGLITGFSDRGFASADPATEQRWLNGASQAGAGLFRITVNWAELAPARPANPGDAADPAYRFGPLDVIVVDAVRSGLAPMLTIAEAPGWAEGPGRPGGASPGSWRPDPSQLGLFAAAIARRYGGGFPGPTGPLPRVSLLQAWNEPNLDTYLAPQWQGRRPVGALQYRSLLNAFYAGVKSAAPGDTVIAAGTAPFGDPPGGRETRPLTFWRTVLCLKQRNLRLRRGKCPKAGIATLDVLAHHPINAGSRPTKRAISRDDASSADLQKVSRILRAAERFGTVRPPGHRPLWATETWWETNPLDGQFGVPAGLQAYQLEQALYLIWKGGGSAAINLQVADTGVHLPGRIDQTGVFLADGTPKPSLTAFHFPFVADRLGPKAVRAWGKAPATGTLLVEQAQGSGWRVLRSLSVGSGQVFSVRLGIRKGRLRASVAGETSLVWSV